eukprot:CAMPEP_0194554920 /NCGR_PEP_ID=MMETSP0253-20130528/97979_1 /TAXON_ID=2966 /ORGANISM="Noctiluca scintillans" /LENGTH=186 /DNA_ID=CAMNT_0039402413 /DNA_START=724 /DNA_END=1281 /DNA_ORIENTATION=-
MVDRQVRKRLCGSKSGGLLLRAARSAWHDILFDREINDCAGACPPVFFSTPPDGARDNDRLRVSRGFSTSDPDVRRVGAFPFAGQGGPFTLAAGGPGSASSRQTQSCGPSPFTLEPRAGPRGAASASKPVCVVSAPDTVGLHLTSALCASAACICRALPSSSLDTSYAVRLTPTRGTDNGKGLKFS